MTEFITGTNAAGVTVTRRKDKGLPFGFTENKTAPKKAPAKTETKKG